MDKWLSSLCWANQPSSSNLFTIVVWERIHNFRYFGIHSGQLESKAELGMNSGTGTNDGIFRIDFDDGTKMCCCTAGGEVSGLVYGDRKFNVQGKGRVLFTQAIAGPQQKTFLLRLFTIHQKKVSFQWKNNNNLKTHFRVKLYRPLPNLFTLYKIKEEPQVRNKLYVNWVNFMESGINKLFMRMNHY